MGWFQKEISEEPTRLKRPLDNGVHLAAAPLCVFAFTVGRRVLYRVLLNMMGCVEHLVGNAAHLSIFTTAALLLTRV